MAIVFDGVDITGLESSETCELGIGQVAEGRQIFPSLTVEENLLLGSALRRSSRDTQGTSSVSTSCSPALSNGAAKKPERCRAASSRCWRSAAA